MKRLSVSLILSLLMVAALAVLLGQSAGSGRAAGTLTVCPAGPPTCDYAVIQDAVDAAVAGDLIKIAAGTYTQINNQGGLAQIVYIDKGVTLRGGYDTSFAEPADPATHVTILDAQGQGRAIYVIGADPVTVENLTITGGDPSYLTPLPYAGDFGGGIYAQQSTITIRNNIIEGNTDGERGGWGGGVYLRNCVAMVDGNAIQNNVASCGAGLGVEDGQATVQDNTVTANQAYSDYGAIHIRSTSLTPTDAEVDLIGNLISGNTGSGIDVYIGNVGYFGNQILGHNQGGIIHEYGTAVLEDNLIEGNSTAEYFAGAGVHTEDCGSVTLRRNTIRNNHATGGFGGGVFSQGSSSFLMVGNLVESNDAHHSGGGVSAGATTLEIYSNTIISNTAGSDGGGAEISSCSTCVLQGNVFAHNTADDYGGGARTGGNTRLVRNEFIDNSAYYGGGLSSSYYPLEMDGDRLLGNTANQGGGLYFMELPTFRSLISTVVLENCQPVGNKCPARTPTGSGFSFEALKAA